jgi:cardiolipin synthase
MKKILKMLFSRLFFVGFAILVQLIWIFVFVYKLSSISIYMTWGINIISFIAILWLVNNRINPSYKLAWTILILIVPVFGATLYFIFGKSRLARETAKKFNKIHKSYEQDMLTKPEVREELSSIDQSISNQSLYIDNKAKCPLYKKTTTEYFATGEELYQKMVEELKKAKHFIFMEYFIINRGEMWSTVLEILEQKVKEGVDVRLIYDDMGCVTTLPARFYKTLQAKGIKCAAFNPFRPVLSMILNNRDHRKISVIDGHTSFTGGINIADEYINKKKRFGYWKDTGIMLKGEGVWSFTTMFLQMWEVITHIPSDYDNYKPQKYISELEEIADDGFVQPYCDTPLDKEAVGENVYLNMIQRAKNYIYIFTPYLIIDNEMMTALCLAAASGVDVRIVTPGIPDKKMVFVSTQSYYSQLVDSEVKIYEYNPGFLHAKSFVCDDEVAIVGTINMDYRSLYLHFECGVWMYQSKAVMQVKEDVLQVLEECTLITSEFCRNRNIVIRIMQNILRLFAPLL